MQLLDPRTGAQGGFFRAGRLALLALLAMALGGWGYGRLADWRAAQKDDTVDDGDLDEEDVIEDEDDDTADQDTEALLEADDHPEGDDTTSIDDVIDDYVVGQYAAARAGALEIADGLPDGDADRVRALRIAGASSCFLKDEDGARSAWQQLPQLDRLFVRTLCERNGVDLP